MIQARAVAPTPDLCCLPSPHRIPQGIAGMAFNFSKIEVAHHPSQRKAPLQDTTQRKPKDSARA
jgi:hypothetical protein